MISRQAVPGKRKKNILALSLSLKHDPIPHNVYLYQQLFAVHEMKQLQKLQGCFPLCDANLLTVGTTVQQAVHEGHQVVYIYYSGNIGVT